MKKWLKVKKSVAYALLFVLSLWGMPAYASHSTTQPVNGECTAGSDCNVGGIGVSGTVEGFTLFSVTVHNSDHTTATAITIPTLSSADAQAGKTVKQADQHLKVTFDDNNALRDIQIYFDNYSSNVDPNKDGTTTPEYTIYDSTAGNANGETETAATYMMSGLRGSINTLAAAPLFWAAIDNDTDAAYTITGDSTKEGYSTDIRAECLDATCKDSDGNATITQNTYSFLDSYANMAFAISYLNASLAAFPTCSTADTNGNGTAGECDVDKSSPTDGDCADSGDIDKNGNGTCEYDFRQITDGEFAVYLGVDYKGQAAQSYSGSLFVEIYTEIDGDDNHHL
ncbi:MAG: hypothetical protein HYS07_00370 [Chlamydiae bacterium]|nr:hypothetical protein [Chlamydiota bacterium]MBI3278113.1 hypothetical protein [Chlamydiota bacterium]